MKKIFLVLLLVFCWNIKIEALEYDIYYSAYSDYSEYSEEKIDSNELLEVDIERRYKWYEETNDGEYMLYDEGIKKYDLVDLTDYKLTSFSSWQINKPLLTHGRIIEEKKRYKIIYVKPINKVYISNINLEKEKVDFGDIEIYNNNNKINFNIFCGGCEDELTLYNENGFVMIDLDNNYYIEDLLIKINGLEVKHINSFEVMATAPNGIDSQENVFFTASFINDGVNNIVIDKDNFNVTNPIYEESIIYDYMPSVTTFDLVEEIKEYRFRDKLYYFYSLNRKYLDGYYLNYEGFEVDKNQYKDFYRYRVRDKMEVAKEIVITEYNSKLEDFICSTDEYEINTNVNYSENGKYYAEFKTSFKTVRKEIIVDIVENELKHELQEITDKYNKLISNYNLNITETQLLKKEYEQVIKEYDELLNKYKNDRKQINELSDGNVQITNNYNKLVDSYNEVVRDNDNKYFMLLNENSNLNYKINTLKDEYNLCLLDLNNAMLKNEDNEKKLKLSNQANDYLKKSVLKIDNNEAIEIVNFVPFLFLGLFGLIIVIIFLKKKSSKNKF